MKFLGPLTVFLALLALTACAGSSQPPAITATIDDPVATVMNRGYQLGEEVKRINNYTINGWQYVSDEAIIIPARPSLDYLVLLRTRCRALKHTEVIGLTSTTGSVLSNFDAIVAYDHPTRLEEKCFIDKIYQLEKAKSAATEP